MKKEVIEVSSGKQFVEDIKKISQQAKGSDLYIDDEIANHVIEVGNSDKMTKYYLVNGYKIFLAPADEGFHRLACVRQGHENIYMYPHPEQPQKQIRIVVA